MMMARRQYTSAQRDTSFELDGVVFTPAGLSLLDFAGLAKYADLDVESAEGIGKLDEFFRCVLGEDYQRFRDHCAQHHTDPNTMMQIITDILTDVLGFPTQRSSASTDGPPTTGRTLRVISCDGQVREELLTPEREAQVRAAVERATG